jgi:hypothetical protein
MVKDHSITGNINVWFFKDVHFLNGHFISSPIRVYASKVFLLNFILLTILSTIKHLLVALNWIEMARIGNNYFSVIYECILGMVFLLQGKVKAKFFCTTL